MRESSLSSLWAAIKDLFGSIYQTLLDDQKRMDMLKAEHKRKEEIAQMDLSGEWSDSRGKEGEPWYVKVNNEEEDILGI